MKDYFFIPGSKLHKLEYIKTFDVQVIIDLEDAVKASERDDILNKLYENSSLYKSYYIRIPLYDQSEDINLKILHKLLESGFYKFIFPKLKSASDYKLILKKVESKNLHVILLVETSRFFLELENAISFNSDVIKGLALGSHDFMSEIGGEHSLKNLEYPRVHLLYLARMINAEAIDIASMELSDEESFKNELIDGVKKGYDGKFYIHPWQLKCKQSLDLYSPQEYSWAKKVVNSLKKVGRKEEFNPIIIDNQIIERPHLNKAKKIIEYYETKQLR